MSNALVSVLAAAIAAGPAAGQIVFLEESFDYDRALPAAGHWLGNVQPGRFPDTWTSLAIERDEAGAWSAKITLITALALNTPCERVEIEGDSVVFKVPVWGAPTFQGKVSDDGQRLRGSISFDGAEEAEGTFELARTPRPTDLSKPMAYAGALESPSGKLEMTFVFAETPGGNWVGAVDVPAQMLLGFPLMSVERDGQKISAELPVPGLAHLDGELAEDESRLTGQFKQGPFVLEVDFPRRDDYAAPTMARPQHPEPPYPYLDREVTIEHPDGHTLAGTLTMPGSGGPFAAAVLVSGSGPQDRDETLMGHKPFLVIADHLTRNGIAVLRYDDRGNAGSTGQFKDATTKDLATDALAAVNFLKTVADVDPQRIGIIGHSEGGLIAPMVASESNDVAYIVLLAGTGVPGDEILRLQLKLLLEAGGMDEEVLAGFQAQQEKALDLIVAGASEEELEEAIRPVLEAQLKAMGFEGEEREEAIDSQLGQLSSPWMRYFINCDPRPYLSRVRCPVLALNGTLDLQVWHEQNLPQIEKAVLSGGGDVTVRRYEGLNHLFQPATTGSIGEYGQIETTFDEAVMDDIVDWIDRKVGR